MVVAETFRLNLPQQRPGVRRFEALWRKTLPALAFSERHIFGEATAGSLCKIWTAIGRTVQVDPGDTVLDWGAGAGKMLAAARFFGPHAPTLRLRGHEIDAELVQKCRRNLALLGCDAHVEHGDSSLVQDFGVVHVVVQYDGPAVNHVQPYHETIMRTLVANAHVKCIFSTKMNPQLFYGTYFPGEQPRSKWRCLKIPNLCFQGCRMHGYLYISRILPTGRIETKAGHNIIQSQ